MLNVIMKDLTPASLITFDDYVTFNIFEKYDNKRPDSVCLTTLLSVGLVITLGVPK